MKNKKEMIGGRVGKIYKSENWVIRPANLWTRDVHKFLNFIIDLGADFVPKPITITNENKEIVSYVLGDVFNYPLPEKLQTDEMLISVAKLLHRFHEYSAKFIELLNESEIWMLPIKTPVEVICHGDFAPYNITIIENRAYGIIDFDTVHPGSRLWDIVYAVYRIAPLKNPNNPDSLFPLQKQIARAKLFLDVYGLDQQDRKKFVNTLIKRLDALVNFMLKESGEGNRDFQENINDGHHTLYLDDIDYLKENKGVITDGIK